MESWPGLLCGSISQEQWEDFVVSKLEQGLEDRKASSLQRKLWQPRGHSLGWEEVEAGGWGQAEASGPSNLSRSLLLKTQCFGALETRVSPGHHPGREAMVTAGQTFQKVP